MRYKANNLLNEENNYDGWDIELKKRINHLDYSQVIELLKLRISDSELKYIDEEMKSYGMNDRDTALRTEWRLRLKLYQQVYWEMISRKAIDKIIERDLHFSR